MHQKEVVTEIVPHWNNLPFIFYNGHFIIGLSQTWNVPLWNNPKNQGFGDFHFTSVIASTKIIGCSIMEHPIRCRKRVKDDDLWIQ